VSAEEIRKPDLGIERLHPGVPLLDRVVGLRHLPTESAEGFDQIGVLLDDGLLVSREKARVSVEEHCGFDRVGVFRGERHEIGSSVGPTDGVHFVEPEVLPKRLEVLAHRIRAHVRFLPNRTRASHASGIEVDHRHLRLERPVHRPQPLKGESPGVGDGHEHRSAPVDLVVNGPLVAELGGEGPVLELGERGLLRAAGAQQERDSGIEQKSSNSQKGLRTGRHYQGSAAEQTPPGMRKL
jgi:hypothetical protein